MKKTLIEFLYIGKFREFMSVREIIIWSHGLWTGYKQLKTTPYVEAVEDDINTIKKFSV